MTRTLGHILSLQSNHNSRDNMSSLKLKIGEFSKLCQVTVKTLRHYEKIGLLEPSQTDSWTGYRYYDVGQFQKMNAIRKLKELGFSLEEIRDMYDRDSHFPDIEDIEEKLRLCEEELERLEIRREQLQLMKSFQKEKKKMENISIQTLPAITVASYQTVIPNYEALGEVCCNIIGPEMMRIGCTCPEPGYCFTVELAGEYRPTDIEIEYCEQVEKKLEDSELIKFKDLPEVPTAVCMKCYGPYSELYRRYQEVFLYISQNGYKITGAPRANYVDGIWNQEDPQKWLTIIQVPVEKE